MLTIKPTEINKVKKAQAMPPPIAVIIFHVSAAL